MYAVCVMLRLKPGTRDAFMPMMTTNAQTSLRDEPDCHRFDVATDSKDTDCVFLYEVYSDRAGFDTHLATDHFKIFDATTAGMIDDKTVVTWDTVVT